MMDGMNMNALQFEASVIDGPVINSRAGLYVYINAMVTPLSTTELHSGLLTLPARRSSTS